MKTFLKIAALATFGLVAGWLSGQTITIGPGQTYANIGDAPWSTMASGTTVEIYPKALVPVVTSGTVGTPSFTMTLTATLGLSGGSGGSGYTTAGTCTLTGGTLVLGTADTCTVTLSSGALVYALVGTGLYTAAPTLSVSGSAGGTGATDPTVTLVGGRIALFGTGNAPWIGEGISGTGLPSSAPPDYVTAIAGSLALSGGSGGSGYTGTGTCTLQFASSSQTTEIVYGTPDTCTATLSGGVIQYAISGNAYYLSPPYMTVTGFSGGTGAVNPQLIIGPTQLVEFNNWYGYGATSFGSETMTGYGSTITLTTSAGSIPMGSELYYGTPVCNAATAMANEYTCAKPNIVTCGLQGSGLDGVPQSGTACAGDVITTQEPINVPSGTTIDLLPPYFEKLIVTNPGITVTGMQDATTGLYPILDSNYATTGPNMAHAGSTAYHDSYAGNALFDWNASSTAMPIGDTIEYLTFSHTWSGITMYDGTNLPYAVFDGYSVRGDNWADSTLAHISWIFNNQGMFMADNPGNSQADVVYHNQMLWDYFWQNGMDAGNHQSYIESAVPYGIAEYGVLYEFNWYDSPYHWTRNDQLKDRSAGTVIAYNRFNLSSGYAPDLVAAQNSMYDDIEQVAMLVPTGGFAANATTLVFGTAPTFPCSTTAGSNTIGGTIPATLTTSTVKGFNIIATGLPSGNVSSYPTTSTLRLNAKAASTNTSETCTYDSVQNINVGDRVCYVNNTVGWAYPGTTLPVCPTVSAVDTATNTLTLNSPGIPAAVPAGAILSVVSEQVFPYRQRFVYGNLYDMSEAGWNQTGGLPSIVHCCWDTASGIDSVWERAGMTYFYNNSVIVQQDSTYNVQSLATSESDAAGWYLANNLVYTTNYTTGAVPAYIVAMHVGSYSKTGLASGIWSGASTEIGTSTAVGATSNCASWTGAEACGAAPDPNASISFTGFSTEAPTSLYPGGLSAFPYQLQAGSTAIGAGTSTLPAAITSNSLGGNFTPVFQPDGTARTNLNDLGAWQYSSTPFNPTHWWGAAKFGFIGGAVLR
ncbi:MAG: hypothetical protein ACYCOU_00215 [Sulfobacillus sp.]